jgi:hypothetical protein
MSSIKKYNISGVEENRILLQLDNKFSRNENLFPWTFSLLVPNLNSGIIMSTTLHWNMIYLKLQPCNCK